MSLSSRTMLVVLALAVLGAGCVAVLKRELRPPQDLLTTDRRSPFLKAHLKDGRLCVYRTWQLVTEEGSSYGLGGPARRDATRPSSRKGLATAGASVSGLGRLLDLERNLVREGDVSFPLDSVALFESNVIVHQLPDEIKALALTVGVMVGAIAIVCAIDPKGCFGSCPTFYVTDGGDPILQAEGFSASVLPVLEASDIDALYRARPLGRTLEVEMKNEAFETHVVRSITLLAAPRGDDDRVFVTADGKFWRTGELVPPRRASAEEGDCAAALRALDGTERFSHADSVDLATRETIDLAFAAPAGATGLVIGARQTLLGTFLFYQTLAYMGDAAGEWMARLESETGFGTERGIAMARELGGIEVMVRSPSGAWIPAGEMIEAGPLATEVRIVTLPAARTRRQESPEEPMPEGDLVEIRLRMTRGLWRIDWVALGTLNQHVVPERIEPRRVLRRGVPDPEARAALLDRGQTLVTTRGDAFTLVFDLPSGMARSELFLESRGYYLEWLREEWRAEEDAALAAGVFLDPRAALRALAPEFKRREASMEEVFWGSRYAHP